eukprot:SAG11_NODE_25353_length_360_cov_0.555556_1_plen_68_part_10
MHWMHLKKMYRKRSVWPTLIVNRCCQNCARLSPAFYHCVAVRDGSGGSSGSSVRADYRWERQYVATVE